MMERYKLEKLIEFWAIYDTENHDYMEESGFRPCFPWVIAYWRQEFHNYVWTMPDFKKAQAEKLLSLLNGKEKQPEKQPEKPISLKLGDEIEVFEEFEWEEAAYISASEHHHHWILLSSSSGPVRVNGNDIRLPIKSRIRRGQPIVYEWCKERKYGFFDELIAGGKVAVRSSICMRVTSDWRLPTKKELESLGQDGLGWLTEDE
jgi:hypothetical protein